MSAVIETRGLTRRFGSFTAVDRVEFQVAPGEIFGYLGANGAGKSTTIRMLCGLLAPTAGEARVAGVDVARHPGQVKRSIGYMSQRFSLYRDLTPEENLEFFSGAYGLRGEERRQAVRHALEQAQLTGHRGRLTGSLPQGFRQRLALACALVHQPRVVFLDEPTAGVDPVSRRAFWGWIRRLAGEGTTVFVTTHYMDEAEYCGRIGLMVAGRLVALDEPEELKRRYVPGRIFSIRGPDVHRVVSALRATRVVRRAETFGAQLRVELEPGAGQQPDLRALLVSMGLQDPEIEPVEATLEDVFLRVADEAEGVSP